MVSHSGSAETTPNVASAASPTSVARPVADGSGPNRRASRLRLRLFRPKSSAPVASPEPPPEVEAVESPTPRLALPRVLSLLIGVAAVLIIVDGIGPLRNIVAASFLALNLVIVVWPIQQLLARVLPRAVASIVAGLVAIILLLALLASIAWAITRMVQTLPEYSDQFSQMISSVQAFADRYDIKTTFTMEELFNGLSRLNIGSIVSGLTSVAASFGSAVWLIALIIMILIFMTMDSMSFSERMKRLSERHNSTLAWGLGAFARGVRRYWVVASGFGLIVALTDWVLLLALGVPLAGVWGVFSFVTNFIPNIGFIIGLVPPVIMALLDSGPVTAIWVIIGYVALNTIFQSFIQPRVSGNAVGITPTVAVLSLLVWSVVLGPLGAILAIPATLFFKTLLVDIDPQNRWLNTLIAANPKTSEEDPIRLSELLERAKGLRRQRRRGEATAESADEATAAQSADATSVAATTDATAGSGTATTEPADSPS
ncbi:MAG: AI-2E family transporter [Propionibacteriaceae bacterium]|jgi:predicted PurR-regulated permease PerM|nr:AI-2E family transporter [Propionibacteriaceae bacterium]